MDGKTLIEMFLDAVDKPEVDMLQLNSRTIYRNMDAAAIEFARQTRLLTGTATIVSSQGSSRYDLPPDFIDLYVYDGNRRLVVKYVDGDGNAHWPVVSDFQKIFRANASEARDYPARIAVVARETDESQITGATTDAGAPAGGEASLKDSGKTFTATAQVRDNVHNTSRQSHGLVLAVTSNTELKCALFGGTSQGFQSGDSYVIVPAAAHQILLDAPSADSDGTFTVPYIRAPAPVFSDYGTWGLPEQSCRAICMEAAFQFLSGKKLGYPVAQRHKAFLDEVRRVREEMAMRMLQGDSYPVRM